MGSQPNSQNSGLSAIAKLTLDDDQLRSLTAQPVIFNGDNYAAFSKSVKSILKQSGKETYLEKVIIQTTPVDEKKESKAVAFQLLQWIAPDLRAIYDGPDRFASEVWSELKQIYGDEVDYEQFHQIQKLTKIRISDYETRTKFLCDFQQTLLLVERTDNFSIPDKLKIVLLVNSLEDKLGDVVAQAPAISTYKDFLDKVKVKVLKPNLVQSNQASFLMKSYQQNNRFNSNFRPDFGQPANQQFKFNNHNQSNYQRNPNFNRNFSQNRDGFPNRNPQFSQNNFNNFNTNSNQQQSNQFKQNPNSYQQSGIPNARDYGRGRGRGFNAQRNFYSAEPTENDRQLNANESSEQPHEQPPHQESVSNHEPNRDQHSTQQRNYGFCNRVLTSGCLPDDAVIQDSASSRPIFKNKNFFIELRPLTDSERRSDGVRTGCGNVMFSTAIGTVRLQTRSGIVFTIQNARYVPNFEGNVVGQPIGQPFNIYPDDDDLWFIDKVTNKKTKIGSRRSVDNLYQFDLINSQAPPSLFVHNNKQ